MLDVAAGGHMDDGLFRGVVIGVGGGNHAVWAVWPSADGVGFTAEFAGLFHSFNFINSLISSTEVVGSFSRDQN